MHQIFWKTQDEPTLTAYPVGWVERVQADRRGGNVMELGAILHTDWMTRVLMQMIKTNVVAKRERMKVQLADAWTN